MKQAAFARVLGVSHQMVSKYAKDGVVVVDDNGVVQVEASLRNLEGRLRPEKYARAVSVCRETRVAEPVPPFSAPSAKIERDAIERDLKKLELGQRAGALVLVEEVDAAGREAIEVLRTALNNGRRDLAAEICTTYGVPLAQQGALGRTISRLFESALGEFARALRIGTDQAESISADA